MQGPASPGTAAPWISKAASRSLLNGPWLDGIDADDGLVRQSVATPLGNSATVEEQLSDGRPEGAH